MSTSKKFWSSLIGVILAMAIIACSCGTIIPTLTAPAQSSSQEPATVPAQSGSQEPATATAQSSDQEPIPGLAGIWQDPLTLDTFEIEWERYGGKYRVLNAVWIGPTYMTSFDITSQSWNGSSLKWTYYNYNDKLSITYETTSLSGDSLYTNWSNDQGSVGPHTLVRLATYPG